VLQARKAVFTEFKPVPPQQAPQPGRRPRTIYPGKKATLLLMAVVCFVLGIVVIAQYSSIVSLHFQLSRNEIRLVELAEEFRSLELEGARLSALGRIDHIARIELGMREPDISQIRILTASREDGAAVEE
jgi:cell division protein FtsL